MQLIRNLKRKAVNWVLNKQAKKFLDGLPANGKKTYLGIAVLVLSFVIQSFDPSNSYFEYFIMIRDLILTYDVQIITDPHLITGVTVVLTSIVGAGEFLIGVYHKILKKFVKDENRTAIESDININ